jgi:hypothetical protein
MTRIILAYLILGIFFGTECRLMLTTSPNEVEACRNFTVVQPRGMNRTA